MHTFAKLTSKQKGIFHDSFKYEMHDSIIANNLQEFDTELNKLKNNVTNLASQNKEIVNPSPPAETEVSLNFLCFFFVFFVFFLCVWVFLD